MSLTNLMEFRKEERMKTVKWECPKCGNKKAVYHGLLGLHSVFEVKQDPGCQNCGLKRFSREYHDILKQRNNAPVAEKLKS